ncbi:MAG: DUF4190 domain-containing protein [Acidimicrobiaceae bacterium]|nr:DUF4190 domain-containing protein [Acidimicrobiaceae bacterium]
MNTDDMNTDDMNTDDTSQLPSSPAKKKESNGLGVAGFVVALVGAVLCWVPILGIVLSLIGVIFSTVGLRAATRFDAPRKGLSIAGLAVGIAALVASIFVTVLVLVVVDAVVSCLDHYNDYLQAPIGSEAETEAYDRWIECGN